MYIIENEDRGSQGDPRREEELGKLGAPLQDLGEVEDEEGELEELSALLQNLEDVGDRDEDLWSLARSCRALRCRRWNLELGNTKRTLRVSKEQGWGFKELGVLLQSLEDMADGDKGWRNIEETSRP